MTGYEITTIMIALLSLFIAGVSMYQTKQANELADVAQKEISKLQNQSNDLQEKELELQKRYESLKLKVSGKLADSSKVELSRIAYVEAIKCLLALKQNFAQNPELFIELMTESEALKYIPQQMQNNPKKFLLLAGGMWQLSYTFSVWNNPNYGLSEGERDGLFAEMKLWLGLEGFKEVYIYHTSQLRAHNPDFLKFLETEIYPDVNRTSD